MQASCVEQRQQYFLPLSRGTKLHWPLCSLTLIDGGRPQGDADDHTKLCLTGEYIYYVVNPLILFMLSCHYI